MDKLAGTMPRVPIRNHIKHFSGSLGLLGGFLAFDLSVQGVECPG